MKNQWTKELRLELCGPNDRTCEIVSDLSDCEATEANEFDESEYVPDDHNYYKVKRDTASASSYVRRPNLSVRQTPRIRFVARVSGVSKQNAAARLNNASRVRNTDKNSFAKRFQKLLISEI